jgi:hypothetical protein
VSGGASDPVLSVCRLCSYVLVNSEDSLSTPHGGYVFTLNTLLAVPDTLAPTSPDCTTGDPDAPS